MWLTRAETATSADRLVAGTNADGFAEQLNALPLFALPCTPTPPEVAHAA